jgi:hypothetical protein
MEFRWLAAITLWTVLVGPIVGPPARSPDRASASSAKPAPPGKVAKNLR